MRGFCPLRGAIPSVALVSTCVGQDAGSEDNSHPQAQRTLSLVKNLILWLTHYTRAGRATVVRGSRQRLGACVVLPSCRIHTDMAMFCSWVWLAFISHWVFSLIATPPPPALFLHTVENGTLELTRMYITHSLVLFSTGGVFHGTRVSLTSERNAAADENIMEFREVRFVRMCFG